MNNIQKRRFRGPEGWPRGPMKPVRNTGSQSLRSGSAGKLTTRTYVVGISPTGTTIAGGCFHRGESRCMRPVLSIWGSSRTRVSRTKGMVAPGSGSDQSDHWRNNRRQCAEPGGATPGRALGHGLSGTPRPRSPSTWVSLPAEKSSPRYGSTRRPVASHTIGTFPNTGVREFSTPEGWEDALLILESPGHGHE